MQEIETLFTNLFHHCHDDDYRDLRSRKRRPTTR